MVKSVAPEIGRAAMRALLKERSPLGPLKVMAKHVGRFFQIPIPGFRPYVVFGPEANRKVLVTERDKVLWRNTDPVTDLLGRGVLIVDGDEHDHYRKLTTLSILIPGTYLSLMDIIALQDTTWSISPSQTTGILFFGILPLEEVVFFFITNVLITFGMTLLLANVSAERFAEIKKQVRGWKEAGLHPQKR